MSLFIPIYSYLFLLIPTVSYLFLFIPIYSYFQANLADIIANNSDFRRDFLHI